MNKPVMHVLVGLPAVGKSTTRAKLGNGFVYSTDSYIEKMAESLGTTYDAIFSEHIKFATSFMNEGLNHAIYEKRNIIWDQTNLTTKKREKIIQRAKQAGYDVICHSFKSPETDEEIKIWKHRLASRPGKVIPEHILASMLSSYSEPSMEEGFDIIHRIDTFKGCCS